jgi:Adenomatosis polyposis coli down-regulated 1
MKNIYFVFAILILILAACSPERIDIQGNWTSEKLEPLGNGTFGKREFSIQDANWEVKFTLYLDSAAKLPVFTFRGAGAYTLGNPSAKVNGATEGVFNFSSKYVTLHSSDTTLIKNFGFTSCGLTTSQEKEITEDGCSFLESKSTCPQEYDIVALNAGKLFLGKRPEAGKNLCTEGNRPTDLGVPLVKLE